MLLNGSWEITEVTVLYERKLPCRSKLSHAKYLIRAAISSLYRLKTIVRPRVDERKFEIGTRRRQMLHSDVNEGNAKTNQRVPALFVRWSLERQTRTAADFGPRFKLRATCSHPSRV